jgi:hypothetical protein
LQEKDQQQSNLQLFNDRPCLELSLFQRSTHKGKRSGGSPEDLSKMPCETEMAKPQMERMTSFDQLLLESDEQKADKFPSLFMTLDRRTRE